MNIEPALDPRLWSAVQATYAGRNFSGAILDALYFMSDLIREKTGLQSDGVALAGQAFGGSSPKLKVNKLETESEKNVQAGLEQILRGLFQAVRNPRSHGKHTDKQEDADAIIVFVNYLVMLIDQSKSPITKSDLLARVFDPHFVEKDRYAVILASEVPPKYRLDVLLDVIRARETGDCKKLKYFVAAMFALLSPEQTNEVYAAASQELRLAEGEATIRTLLQIFPDDSLSHCDEDARLRTENRMLRSIAEGAYTTRLRRCTGGAFGTWAASRCGTFLQKEELISALTSKLLSQRVEEQAYVFEYFWREYRQLVVAPSARVIRVLQSQLKAGNLALYNRLQLLREFGGEEWSKPFEVELNEFKEVPPAVESSNADDIPF